MRVTNDLTVDADRLDLFWFVGSILSDTYQGTINLIKIVR